MLGADGRPRPAAAELLRMLSSLEPDALLERQRAAEAEILTMGITFTVYSDGEDIDRAWPFDVVSNAV